MGTRSGAIIAGNWKMHKNAGESADFISALEKRLPPGMDDRRTAVIVFPAFTSLAAARQVARRVHIGAQNMYFADQGAFTGEVSPTMLSGLAEYVLVGHSERREIFAENDELLNQKLMAAFHHGLKPVLCIGETLREREAGETQAKVRRQLERDLSGCSADEIARLILAYEPIWAIGTGRNATPQQAQEVHSFIRKLMLDFSADPAALKILYGGSVKPENCRELLDQPDVDGLLIGGASLNIDSFSAIIEASLRAQRS